MSFVMIVLAFFGGSLIDAGLNIWNPYPGSLSLMISLCTMVVPGGIMVFVSAWMAAAQDKKNAR